MDIGLFQVLHKMPEHWKALKAHRDKNFYRYALACIAGGTVLYKNASYLEFFRNNFSAEDYLKYSDPVQIKKHTDEHMKQFLAENGQICDDSYRVFVDAFSAANRVVVEMAFPDRVFVKKTGVYDNSAWLNSEIGQRFLDNMDPARRAWVLGDPEATLAEAMLVDLELFEKATLVEEKYAKRREAYKTAAKKAEMSPPKKAESKKKNKKKKGKKNKKSTRNTKEAEENKSDDGLISIRESDSESPEDSSVNSEDTDSMIQLAAKATAGLSLKD